MQVINMGQLTSRWLSQIVTETVIAYSLAEPIGVLIFNFMANFVRIYFAATVLPSTFDRLIGSYIFGEHSVNFWGHCDKAVGVKERVRMRQSLHRGRHTF